MIDSHPINFADEQILSINDLDEVYSATVDASSEWFELGLALKIQHPTLTNFRKDHHSSDKCLLEMLAHRLKLTPPLTWGHLCECLRKNTVNRHDVAEAITRKHTGTTYLHLIDLYRQLQFNLPVNTNSCLLFQLNQRIQLPPVRRGDRKRTLNTLRKNKVRLLVTSSESRWSCDIPHAVPPKRPRSEVSSEEQ